MLRTRTQQEVKTERKKFKRDGVQNKSGIWCKPTVRMNIMIDGGTDPKQREAIVKQAFEEVCNNIEKVISEME